jgi:plasmid stabilization system protein ParE
LRIIAFSANANKRLESLIDYLELEFSLKTKEKFILNFDKIIYLIQNSPETFPKSTINGSLRRCVVSKQTTIYYKFNSKQIRILSIFDTRQNPLNIKKIQ